MSKEINSLVRGCQRKIATVVAEGKEKREKGQRWEEGGYSLLAKKWLCLYGDGLGEDLQK